MIITPSHRSVCLACRRPATVCYCRHVLPIETRTRVVILQHPRERDVAIGTARMASLCLPGSELHVGVDWRGSRALAAALSDPARPAALLYPGAGALDVLRDPPPGPVTLVVVDGTWWQAKKVVRENPELAALPRYSFTPPAASEYRIRREPAPECVSTIEALVHVLGALEGEPARFQAMLAPFRAMIDAQIACEEEHRRAGSRHVRAPRPAPSPPHVPRALRERFGDVVCVHGEANAWPYGSSERTVHGDELVHWVAERPATGEALDFVLAPRHPLAHATCWHSGLPAEALARGGTASALVRAWRAFTRDGDVLCAWGHHAMSLFLALEGLPVHERLDLRQAARVFLRGKVGTLDDVVARLALRPRLSASPARASLRLSQMSAVARHLHEGARSAPLAHHGDPARPLDADP